ncbi:hypothetical protein KAJ27_07235 [bacterium]|nr:hypothetical protein [bacterium]
MKNTKYILLLLIIVFISATSLFAAKMTQAQFKTNVDKLFNKLSVKVSRTTSGNTFVWNLEHNSSDTVKTNLETLLDNPEDLKVIADQDTNKLFISVKNNNFEIMREALELLQVIDKPAKQVLIEVLIAEFTLGDTNTWESQWRVYSSKTFNSNNLISTTDLQHGGLGATDPTQTEGMHYFIINNQNVNAFLNAQKENNKFNVLSSPHIIASNHQKATFHRGRSVPYLTGVHVNESGVVTNQYSNLKVGINLEVVPHITEDGTTFLEIDQKIDEIISNNAERGTVETSNNHIVTKLTVPDGKTVILSGFIMQNERELYKKVPFLSDIPLIGKFFNKSRRSKIKTELIVFITPKIIGKNASIVAVTEAQKNKLAGKKDINRLMSKHTGKKTTKKRRRKKRKTY